MANGLSLDLRVPFPTAREADVAYGSLSVDPEPPRGGVVRTMSVTGNVLSVHFKAEEARKLRVGVRSFMDHLLLVTRTIHKFGNSS